MTKTSELEDHEQAGSIQQHLNAPGISNLPDES